MCRGWQVCNYVSSCLHQVFCAPVVIVYLAIRTDLQFSILVIASISPTLFCLNQSSNII